MTAMTYDFNNYKFSIVEDEDDFKDDIFVEIKIKKSFISKLMKNFCSFSPNNSSSGLSFTNREVEVLRYLIYGLGNAKISKELNISVHTTKVHVKSICDKLEVCGRTQAVSKVLREHIVEL